MSILISEAIAQVEPTPPAPPSTIANLLPLVLIFFVFYFLVIRPQQKKLKSHNELLDSIGKNDEVVTGGGIIGKVVKVNDDILHVEISPENTVKILRNTLSGRYSKSDTKNEVKK